MKKLFMQWLVPVILITLAWQITTLAGDGDMTSCPYSDTGDEKVCTTTNDVNKILKADSEKDRKKAETEADEFIDSQNEMNNKLFKKTRGIVVGLPGHKKRIHGFKISPDKDFKSNTLAYHLTNSRTDEYKSYDKIYDSFFKEIVKDSKGNSVQRYSAFRDENCKKQKMEADACKAAFMNGPFKKSLVDGYTKQNITPPESFNSLFGEENNFQKLQQMKPKDRESWFEDKAADESDKILAGDREKLINLYLSKKEELDEKYPGDGDKKTKYKNLEFSEKLMKSDLEEVNIVLNDDESAKSVIETASKDPTLIGCHLVSKTGEELKELTDGAGDPETSEKESVTQSLAPYPCEMEDFFQDDKAKLSSKADAAVSKCFDQALKAAEGKKIISVGTRVESCASSVPSKKFSSNLDLSLARSNAMAGAAVNEYEKLLKNHKELTKDDLQSPILDYKGQNKGANGEATGTCGPLPPLGWPTESWCKPMSCSSDVSQGSSAQGRRDNTLEQIKKDKNITCNAGKSSVLGYDWVCDGSYLKKVEGEDLTAFKTRYEDTYSPHRKALIWIYVTVEEKSKDPEIDIKKKNVPKEEVLAVKKVLKCYQPALGYDTYYGGKTRRIGIGLPPWNLGDGLAGSGSDPDSCPTFMKTSRKTKLGKTITVLQYKVWKVKHNRKYALDPDETEMWGGW